MARCKNFEPIVNIAMALAYGSQIEPAQVIAYEYACDYYGDERVAIQKTLQDVENVSVLSATEIMCAVVGADRERIVHLTNDSRKMTVIKSISSPVIRSIYSLFIHWPEVTVSNEKDQSIDIQDVFVRIPMSRKGLTFQEPERFTLMRTTYTRAQWNCAYQHSHTRTFNRTNPFKFRHMCLGTGPINRTISTLYDNPANGEAMMLFFWELDKLMHVESLAGVPYFRLSSVSGNNYNEVIAISSDTFGTLKDLRTGHNREVFQDFLSSFFLSEKIPMGFRGGQYIPGCSFLEFAILLTNYYKKWLDAGAELVRLNCERRHLAIFTMEPYYIFNNKIYVRGGAAQEVGVPSIHPFKFQNKDFPLVVSDNNGGVNYLKCELINLPTIAAILNFILTAVNTATSKDYEETDKQEADFWMEQYSTVVSAALPSGHGPEGFAKGSTTTSY